MRRGIGQIVAGLETVAHHISLGNHIVQGPFTAGTSGQYKPHIKGHVRQKPCQRTPGRMCKAQAADLPGDSFTPHWSF